MTAWRQVKETFSSVWMVECSLCAPRQRRPHPGTSFPPHNSWSHNINTPKTLPPWHNNSVTSWHSVSVTCFMFPNITSHRSSRGWLDCSLPNVRAQLPPATKQLFAVLAHSCTAPQCPTHHTKLLRTFHPPKQPVTACNHCVPALYTILYGQYGHWPLQSTLPLCGSLCIAAPASVSVYTVAWSAGEWSPDLCCCWAQAD